LTSKNQKGQVMIYCELDNKEEITDLRSILGYLEKDDIIVTENNKGVAVIMSIESMRAMYRFAQLNVIFDQK